MTANNIEHKNCPKCQQPLEYGPEKQGLECISCGGYDSGKIPNYKNAISESDYVIALDEPEEIMDVAYVISCSKCGGIITKPSTAADNHCFYCDSHIDEPPKDIKLIHPVGVIPFRLTETQAIDYLMKWLGSYYLAPSTLKKLARQHELRGIYIPYWTFNSRTTVTYDGEKGEKDEKGEMKWTAQSGTARNKFWNILVPASKALPAELLESLGPWSVSLLRSFDPDYLRGFRQEIYSLSLKDGFETVKHMIAPDIDDAARREIGGDDQKINSKRVKYEDVTFKHILLPVYVMSYHYMGKLYRVAVNGCNGKVYGDAPLSVWKVSSLIALIVILIGLIIYLITLL